MFADREDAGRQLARALAEFAGADVVVLGLPRGGVPVADRVAEALHAPLDVIVVRKLGAPFQPELAMGAIGEGGVVVANGHVLRGFGLTERDLDAAQAQERPELDRRVRVLREGRPAVALAGRTALVVDDGIATGSSAEAACRVARHLGAQRVVLAVPVAPADTVAGLRQVADQVVVLDTPTSFRAVGEFYVDFGQVGDDQVVELLRRAHLRADARRPLPDATPGAVDRREVRIPVGPVTLEGALVLPADALGVVIFAHGSGSSRLSPRNQQVAEVLQQAGMGTLLFDLLTDDEAPRRSLVFDVDLLADRLLGATHWLREQAGVGHLRLGYFGASTGAAAALWAAADPRAGVSAVVSRGGRPDLAAERLPLVTAPTLLLVGGHDDVVLVLNRRVEALMPGVAELVVVPGATHLFEEPGALETVADLAGSWFQRHLAVAEAVT